MADRYWFSNNPDKSWHATGPTNWSDSPTGPNDFSIPGPGDNVFFTVNSVDSCTINTPVTVDNVTYATSYSGVLTLNALLRVTGTLKFNTGNTLGFIQGTSGFDVNNLVDERQGRTMRFTAGNTYRIRDSFVATKGDSQNVPLQYSTVSNIPHAKIILDQGAICNTIIGFFAIDASQGRTINQLNTVAPSNCINIVQMYMPFTFSYYSSVS